MAGVRKTASSEAPPNSAAEDTQIETTTPARSNVHPLPTSSSPTAESNTTDVDLASLLAGVGDGQGAQLSLHIQRIRQDGRREARPSVPNFPSLLEQGLDIAEIIGRQCGDGDYRWEIKHRGKYLQIANVSTTGKVTVAGFPAPTGFQSALSPEASKAGDLGEIVRETVAPITEAFSRAIDKLAERMTPPAPPAHNDAITTPHGDDRADDF